MQASPGRYSVRRPSPASEHYEELPAAGADVSREPLFASAVGRLARDSLVEEVSVTPKPGLVDRDNSGAHRDMDYSVFIASARALEPYFAAFAREGAARRGMRPADIFDEVRPTGIAAEAAMFAATGGVNTHKGLIFSLGILSAAAGVLAKEGELTAPRLCAFAARMTEGLLERDLGARNRPGECGPPTKGERLYREHGIRGVRGEAAGGFGTVRALGLPMLRRLSAAYPDRRNEVLLAVLLWLMTRVTDTNVVGRHDFRKLEFVQNGAARALFLGGPFTEAGMLHIRRMDRDFISLNISPGGSADLLAVTIFLEKLERRGSPLTTPKRMSPG